MSRRAGQAAREDDKTDQSLIEYLVGKANQTCTCPRIFQRFANAGWTQTGLSRAHVSPGTTQDEMDAIFARLRDMGGDTVMNR
jgi:hypothetical protein